MEKKAWYDLLLDLPVRPEWLAEQNEKKEKEENRLAEWKALNECKKMEQWDPWEKDEKPRRRERAIAEAIRMEREMEQRALALWEAGWVLPESVHAWQSM